MDRLPCVYLLASGFHGRLYTGVTSNLLQRIAQHRDELGKGHTSRYSINRLVWFEIHEEMESAIIREKRIKRWVRPYKYVLVEQAWSDWEKRPAGYRRSALGWVTGAKRPETRAKRLAELIAVSAEGRRLPQYDWQKK